MTFSERVKLYLPPKEELKKGAKMTLVTSVLVILVMSYLISRYQVLYTTDEVKCLDITLALIDTWDKDIGKGDLFVFKPPPHYKDLIKSEKMKQYVIEKNPTLMKIAAAVTGDHVTVNDRVAINGDPWGVLTLVGMNKVNGKLEDFARDEIVPEGKIFALGTLPRSYDSRYWGYADRSWIIGRGYKIY